MSHDVADQRLGHFFGSVAPERGDQRTPRHRPRWDARPRLTGA